MFHNGDVANIITVYRRHRKSRAGESLCVKGHEQNDRVFPVMRMPGGLKTHQPVTRKQKDQDCDCPLVCDGSLENESSRLKFRAIGADTWDDAIEIVQNWLEWGQTTEPVDAKLARHENMTVLEAVQQYMEEMRGRNVDPATRRKYDVLFRARLLPWCEANGIDFIRELEDLTTVRNFVYSWRNLNPGRNRNVETDEDDRELAVTTRHAEMERFRAFMRFCLDSEYIRRNVAPKVKLEAKSSDQRRFGMSQEEYKRLEEQAELWSDSWGRLDGTHAKRLQAMVRLLRYSGLRISDAVMLAHDEIVPRTDGSGYAIYKRMLKLENAAPVYVPIPLWLRNELTSLPVRGAVNGRDYIFWTGAGKKTTAITNFKGDLTELIRRAQDPDDSGKLTKPFRHPASIHSLRHTFATLSIASGIPIQIVQTWLGHSSLRTTEAHYLHACPERNRASEAHYDQMMETMSEKPKAGVVQIRRRKA